MTRQEAIEALRAQGIRNPSRQLVEEYMRLQQAEEWALEVPERSSVELAGERSQTPNSAPERTEKPHPSSESNLAPLLRDRGELVRERGPRRAGRPRVQAPWFKAVATVMADGTPLRQALVAVGVHGLTECQIRSLYRNRAFQALYKEARRKYQSEYGVRQRRTVGKGLRQLLRSF